MNIAIIPYAEEIMEDPGKWLFYSKIKECSKGTGINWKVISEYDDWNSIDYFLFYNFYYAWGFPILKKINKMHRRDRILFCMMEPEAVHFYHARRYLPLIRKFTDCIITWNKDLVDGKHVFFTLFHSWQGRELRPVDYVPGTFQEKKLLCNISGNKKSGHPHELYSERKKVVEYFEGRHAGDFSLYGTGWESCHYKNYQGRCKTKGEVYRNYRFALSLENQKNVRGYITEKIMDCIVYGIVPIYEGASDILEYVPQECFIPYSKFGSVEALYRYIKAMGETEYSAYLDAQRKFILEGGYQDFTVEAWAKQVHRAIGMYHRGKCTATPPAWFAVLEAAHFACRLKYMAGKVMDKIRNTLAKERVGKHGKK